MKEWWNEFRTKHFMLGGVQVYYWPLAAFGIVLLGFIIFG